LGSVPEVGITVARVYLRKSNSTIKNSIGYTCVGHHHTQDRRRRQIKQKTQHNCDITMREQTQIA
jgi:hypothetical protein